MKLEYFYIRLLILFYASCALALHQNPSYRVRATSDVQNSRGATIIEQNYVNEGSAYNFNYQTSDGVSREEKAEVKNAGSKDESLTIRGSYSYIGDDGVTYTINYVADENGYRPLGAHIPSL